MNRIKSKDLIGIIIPVIVVFFNILIILFPTDIINAARNGLLLWFNSVLPSLLPFIIGTNILIGLGFVSFLGTLLEPLMVPIFGVPGCGAFPLITGMTSGYPMGAKTTAILREKQQLSKTEAQRLIGFVNNSGPLFMLGAVGVGMFHSASIGYFIMICHYLGAIVTGLILKYYKYGEKTQKISMQNPINQAFKNMRTARQNDGRTFGEVVGDSVKNACETIAIVGGFIILFCVIVEILNIIGVIHLFESILSSLLLTTEIDSQLIEGFIVGIIEITSGTKILSEHFFSKEQIIMTIGIISFGGFSIHSQTLSFINKTDISGKIYIATKALHAIIAMFIARIIFPFFKLNVNETVTVFFWQESLFLNRFAWSFMMFFISIIAIFIFTLILTLFNINRSKRRVKPLK